MSIEIKNLVINKKFNISKVNLATKQGEPINIFDSNTKNLNSILKILRNHKEFVEGEYKIDGFDSINKKWSKYKITFINKRTTFLKLIPPKLYLYFSLIFNRDFYKSANKNLIESKSNYMNFKNCKKDKLDFDMRSKVDVIINDFISTSIDIEDKFLGEFRESIRLFSDSEVNEHKGINNKQNILLRKYFDLIDESNILRLKMTFLQSLWDKVYSLLDLRSSCDCSYETKISKDKKIKRLFKKLNFDQIFFIIKKHLKLIDIEVRNLRVDIIVNNFRIKSLKNKIKFDFIKSKNKLKHFNIEDNFNFRQIVNDQTFEFTRKQEKIFFESLSDESNYIKGLIVNLIHEYHKKILNNVFEYFTNEDFIETKKDLKQKISSISSQSYLWINEIANKLNMKFNWVQNTFKISYLEQLYVKILSSIFLGKKNIVLYNSGSLLTSHERRILSKVIKKIIEVYPDTSVIQIEKSIRFFFDLKSDFYIVDNKELKIMDNKANIFYNIGNDYLNKNIPLVLNIKGVYTVFDNKIKKTKPIKENEVIYLNPLYITDDKKNHKGNIIDFEVIIKKRHFADFTIHEGMYKGEKILFTSDSEFEKKQKVKLYFAEEDMEIFTNEG